jgi:hypothetical protein
MQNRCNFGKSDGIDFFTRRIDANQRPFSKSFYFDAFTRGTLLAGSVEAVLEAMDLFAPQAIQLDRK